MKTRDSFDILNRLMNLNLSFVVFRRNEKLLSFQQQNNYYYFIIIQLERQVIVAHITSCHRSVPSPIVFLLSFTTEKCENPISSVMDQLTWTDFDCSGW
jgi:hypothetical protein